VKLEEKAEARQLVGDDALSSGGGNNLLDRIKDDPRKEKVKP
jgi:hypothetical protein